MPLRRCERRVVTLPGQGELNSDLLTVLIRNNCRAVVPFHESSNVPSVKFAVITYRVPGDEISFLAPFSQSDWNGKVKSRRAVASQLIYSSARICQNSQHAPRAETEPRVLIPMLSPWRTFTATSAFEDFHRSILQVSDSGNPCAARNELTAHGQGKITRRCPCCSGHIHPYRILRHGLRP